MYHHLLTSIAATFEMSRLCSQTLIRSTAVSSVFFSSAARPRAARRLSTLPESSLHVEMAAAEAEAEAEAEEKAVEKMEDVIHSFVVRRSKPDWLTFVPGASYWVPPRRTSYGVAGVFEKLANALTDEEYLSLTTLQGWPSSAFYIHNDTSSRHLGLAGDVTYLHEEEG